MEQQRSLVLPDYASCIANLPNSILRKWSLPAAGKPLSLADTYLEKDWQNVVVLLLDGMGMSVLEKILAADGPFRSHLAGSCTSVFPSTTVAATTSAMSGLQPCEHSWLGWDCYYPQLDKNVTVFLNTVQGTLEPAADYHVARTLTPYTDVVTTINAGSGKACAVAPFLAPYPDSIEAICGQIEAMCAKPGQRYIYAYWKQPDGLLHRFGSGSETVREALRNIETSVSRLADALQDTLLIVTADHRHIDTDCVMLEDYPQIWDCLIRPPSLEPRALNLFVKEDKRAFFEQEFVKEFGDRYLLMPMEEAIERNLFGDGRHHPNFRGMLGDYLAIATGALTIYFGGERWVSTHGSLTEEEMTVPFIVFEC